MTFNGIGKTCDGLLSGPTSVVFDNRTVQYNDNFTALGQEILVAWAASDLTAFTPASAPVLQISLAEDHTSDVTPSPTLDQSSSDGLTQGAKIGIGVTAACVFLILCAITGFVVFRRVQRARKTAKSGDATMQVSGDKNELKAELSGDSHLQEAGGDEVPAEADHMHVRHELEGDWHGYEAHGPRSPT